MAGKGVRTYKKAEVELSTDIDFSRKSPLQRADWREAEGEVYGAEFVIKQEKRIKKGKLLNEKIRDKMIKEGV